MGDDPGQPPGEHGPPRPAEPYPVPQQTNGMAVASLVLGIIWLYWLGSILALIFGYTARRQIDASGGWQTGRGMATAGIVLGWVGVATLVLMIVFVIVGVVVGAGSDFAPVPEM